jgi:hypothetical protein
VYRKSQQAINNLNGVLKMATSITSLPTTARTVNRGANPFAAMVKQQN